MIINGYKILVERGHWVKEELLYHRLFHKDLLLALDHLIKNPTYPAYQQHGDLKRIKRLKLGDVRVYAKLYPVAKILTVIAVVGVGHIKRDERGGELDFNFLAHLHRHSEFLADRFIPLLSIEEYKPPEKSPEEILPVQGPSIYWGLILKSKAIPEEEVAPILYSSRGAAPSDPWCMGILVLISRSPLQERFLFDLPPGSENWEKERIKTLQFSLKRTLAYYDKEYAVRFDEPSRKIIVVDSQKVGVYCYGSAASKSPLPMTQLKDNMVHPISV